MRSGASCGSKRTPSGAAPAGCGDLLLREGEPAKNIPEVFARGSLTWPDDGVVLNVQHDRQQPIVRFVPTRDGDDILVDVELPDNTRGRDAAVSVRDGTLKGLSVEFLPNITGKRNGRVEVRRARLLAAGLVDDGEYATHVDVRHAGGDWQRTERWR